MTSPSWNMSPISQTKRIYHAQAAIKTCLTFKLIQIPNFYLCAPLMEHIGTWLRVCSASPVPPKLLVPPLRFRPVKVKELVDPFRNLFLALVLLFDLGYFSDNKLLVAMVLWWMSWSLQRILFKNKNISIVMYKIFACFGVYSIFQIQAWERPFIFL